MGFFAGWDGSSGSAQGGRKLRMLRVFAFNMGKKKTRGWSFIFHASGECAWEETKPCSSGLRDCCEETSAHGERPSLVLHASGEGGFS